MKNGHFDFGLDNWAYKDANRKTEELKLPLSRRYEELRYWLLGQNFALRELSRIVRNQGDASENKENLAEQIHHLAEEIQCDYPDLKRILLGNKTLSFGGGSQEVVVIDDPNKMRIKERGIYVRYVPGMTKEIWLRYLGIARTYADMAKDKLYPQPKQTLSSKRGVRHQIAPDDEHKVEIYLEIEAKLPKFWEKKQEGKIKDETSSSSGTTALGGAIEELIWEKIGDNQDDNDDALDKMVSTYKGVYYDVTVRYQLPTLRDLSKFLKILDNN